MNAEPSGDGTRATLLRVANVAKAFGATQAVRDASFELRAGEVLALVGENGCGKSTMVKILSGVHAPDAGRDRARRRADRHAPDAEQAQRPRHRHGVPGGPGRRVVLGARQRLARRRRHVAPRACRRARSALARGRCSTELLGREIDLDIAVEELSLSDRQACGIVRALAARAQDPDPRRGDLRARRRDPRPAYSRSSATRAAGRRRHLHHPPHGRDRADRRSDHGHAVRRRVAELERGQWTPQQLVRLMTGRRRARERGARAARAAPRDRGATVLSVRGLKLRADGGPIDLEIKAGELIGLAGLEGPRRQHVPRGAARRRRDRGRGRPPRRRPRGGHRQPGRRRRPRHRLRAARAPPGLGLQLDDDPRELRDADARSRQPLRPGCVAVVAASGSAPTSSASASCSDRPRTRSRRSRAATSRR